MKGKEAPLTSRESSSSIRSTRKNEMPGGRDGGREGGREGERERGRESRRKEKATKNIGMVKGMAGKSKKRSGSYKTFKFSSRVRKQQFVSLSSCGALLFFRLLLFSLTAAG